MANVRSTVGTHNGKFSELQLCTNMWHFVETLWYNFTISFSTQADVMSVKDLYEHNIQKPKQKRRKGANFKNLRKALTIIINFKKNRFFYCIYIFFNCMWSCIYILNDDTIS